MIEFVQLVVSSVIILSLFGIGVWIVATLIDFTEHSKRIDRMESWNIIKLINRAYKALQGKYNLWVYERNKTDLDREIEAEQKEVDDLIELHEKLELLGRVKTRKVALYKEVKAHPCYEGDEGDDSE